MNSLVHAAGGPGATARRAIAPHLMLGTLLNRCRSTQANKYSQEELLLMKTQDVKYLDTKSRSEAAVSARQQEQDSAVVVHPGTCLSFAVEWQYCLICHCLPLSSPLADTLVLLLWPRRNLSASSRACTSLAWHPRTSTRCLWMMQKRRQSSSPPSTLTRLQSWWAAPTTGHAMHSCSSSRPLTQQWQPKPRSKCLSLQGVLGKAGSRARRVLCTHCKNSMKHMCLTHHSQVCAASITDSAQHTSWVS